MKNAQGALEYLLLIGGAILVAVIVISIIVGISGSGEAETLRVTADALCAKYPDAECGGSVEVKGITFNCQLNGPNECRAQPPTSCGNGIVDGGEQCDDDNNNNFDGCSSICQFETADQMCNEHNNDATLCGNSTVTTLSPAETRYCDYTGVNQCTAVPATAIEITGCIIPAAGTTYYLNSNISGNTAACINIGSGANDAIIYCRGKTITNTGGTGISVSGGVSGVLINNCKVDSSGIGIHIRGPNNTAFYNEIISSGTNPGIQVGTAGNGASNNLLHYNNACGSTSANQLFANNTIGQNIASTQNTCDTCTDSGSPSICPCTFSCPP